MEVGQTVTGDVRGGLGNQLFVVFATLAYAKRNGRRPWFPRRTNYGNRGAYWDSLLSEAPTEAPCGVINQTIYMEPPSQRFAEIPIGADILFGYFQSPRHFLDESNSIIHELHLLQKREVLRSKVNAGINVSIHFRLGDYKRVGAPLLGLDYYAAALSAVSSNLGIATILYFFEAEDEIQVSGWINSLKDSFPAFEFKPIQSGENTDWEDMLIMSLCDHHVISNSTFSWWSAFLNPSETKRVACPANWLGDPEVAVDMYPKGWIRIKVD